MQILKSKSGKKEPKQFANLDPIESFESILGGFKKSVIDDLGKNAPLDAKDQITGKLGEDHKSGQLSAGEELDLAHLSEKAVEVTEMGHEFVREVINAGAKSTKEESQEIAVRIQEIIIEIKQLAKSSEELKAQVEIVAVEQMGEDPGKYQLSFIEQVLSWLQDARTNVEDGLAWFKALRSKKAAQQYGAKAKTSGTSFTLSNERVVATQTG